MIKQNQIGAKDGETTVRSAFNEHFSASDLRDRRDSESEAGESVWSIGIVHVKSVPRTRNEDISTGT